MDDESGSFYSWQWWVTGDEYGTYWASGYEGQMISVVPALDALVVRFGHTPEEHYPDLAAWRTASCDVLDDELGALVGKTEVRCAKEGAEGEPSFARHRLRRAAAIDDREDQDDLARPPLGRRGPPRETRPASDRVFGDNDAIARLAGHPRCDRLRRDPSLLFAR